MPYARIWYEPTGVKITVFTDGADPEQVTRVLRADGHVDPAATFEDVDTPAALDAALPADRGARHKWRKNPSGPGVVVDATVPDPPDPDQDLLDAVDGAKTLAELKAAVTTMLKRRR